MQAYLETAREAYEAYVIYSFYSLLHEFMGSDDNVVAALKRKDRLAADAEALAAAADETGDQQATSSSSTTKKHKKKHHHTPGRVHMLPPVCCMRPWKHETFPLRTKRLVFQYVFLRTILGGCLVG